MTTDQISNLTSFANLSAEDLAELSPKRLLDLRSAIDVRLDQVRAEHIEKCEALGIKCTDGNGKKPRRKASKHHEE